MIWVGLALAGDGWEVLKETDHCSFARGPAEDDGNLPLAVSCAWPHVDVETLEKVLVDYAAHDDVWESVATATDAGETDEGLPRVHHVHALPGVADREIELTWTRTEDDGAIKHAWEKSTVQPTIDPDRVIPDRDDGYYLVRPEGEGVVIEALFVYDPGGSIPDWLVRATQVTSAVMMLEELESYAGQ